MIGGSCLLALGVFGVVSCGDVEGAPLYRHWPRMPRPAQVLMVPFVGDHEEGMSFETAAGLAARAVLAGKSELLLCEDVGSPAYQRWHGMFLAQVRPNVRGPVGTWEAIRTLRKMGVVKGYVLFRYDRHDRPWHELGPIDESANVATTLSPLLDAVAVSERLEPQAKDLGLPLLMDARDKTEAWCLEQYGSRCSDRVVMTADPKSRVARSMAVEMGAFVVSRPGKTYEAALKRCQPGSPVLGWGCGAEDAQTLPSSEWGLFQTATNWCHNLPIYSTEQVGETIPRERVRLPDRCQADVLDLQWESGVHYVAFMMSDGDNVQWLMGNFAGGSEGHSYYESPIRGRFPFGWTFPYIELCQLCPYTLVDLFRRATPNDDFVLYGGGYYYPDRFGVRREKEVEKNDNAAVRPDATSRVPTVQGTTLRLHARRIAQYMAFGDLHTLAFNAWDWDGEAAQRAYQVFAEEVPGLYGIFTVQYYPYSGGEGRILWAAGGGRRVPVISARLCIWAQTGRPRDTTPAGVARWLSAMPRGGGGWTEEHFSFIMAHAWSRFRRVPEGAGELAEEEGVDQIQDSEETRRGLEPVHWCVERLDPQVRVVTPARLALLVQLHLNTRETLGARCRQLRPAVNRSRSLRAKQLLAKAERLLPHVRDGDDSGRECFRLLRRARRLVRISSHR